MHGVGDGAGVDTGDTFALACWRILRAQASVRPPLAISSLGFDEQHGLFSS